jgi:hypothetical protein
MAIEVFLVTSKRHGNGIIESGIVIYTFKHPQYGSKKFEITLKLYLMLTQVAKNHLSFARAFFSYF